MERMRRKTKDLPLLKRLMAKVVGKLQMRLLAAEGRMAFKLYYKLAEIHFKLHYGFGLKSAIKCLGGSKTADLSVMYAANRHARMVISINNLTQENIATQKYYSDAAINGFLTNLS